MTEIPKPIVPDFADAEHYVLEDVTAEHPNLYPEFIGGKEPREVREEVVVRDVLRRRQTRLRIYAEGWIDIESREHGKVPSQHQINLRYIDAVPSIQPCYPANAFRFCGAMVALTAIASIPASLGWLLPYTLPAAVIAGVAAIAGLWVSFHRCHEKIVFQTLHGRAGAITLTAGLGTIRQYHQLIPKLVGAIAAAAESVHDETAIYLRAEMREHYRLCNDGVLTDEECAVSTGRILDSFGAQP